MQGDFSRLHFDPLEHERGVSPPSEGVLRNVSGVLHQQGRVMSDADLTEGELLELAWTGQAGRDIIGAGVCAVPATEPDGLRIDAALVSGTDVHLSVRPGRAWADGILVRLPGALPDPMVAVTRRAAYFGPPLTDPLPSTASITDTIRDAVVLEVSQESLHGFQYPEHLIEPALGGPDTAERAYVNARFRLVRLGADEDCTTLISRLADDPAAKGHLTVSLAPPVVVSGDCPVVGGGGYTGFEHNLYRIEIAQGNSGAPARFKWSQWNGGLAGRGRFDASASPAKVILDAGRTPIITAGVTAFYLEALQYDELSGAWEVVYGTPATLNTDHDLELAAPATFGTLPATTEPVFFRLWNGIAEVTTFIDAVNPAELRDGIRLVFDAPITGNYAAGDYWTFNVRAGGITNAAVLIDHAPPVGIVHHRVALAEINWTAQQNTMLSGSIEDCRHRFRPLTNQKVCCTLLVGDGVSSFGDFNSLEEAATHLPAAGGELCLLPGLHRANLRLEGRRDVRIHGCARRTLVLPRTETPTLPILQFADCIGIEVCDLDLVNYDTLAIAIDGSKEGACKDVRLLNNRMIARTNAVRANNAAELDITGNRIHLLDTVEGRATVSLHADDVRFERNVLAILPFVDPTPDEPVVPKDDPTLDPADPCAKPEVLYQAPKFLARYLVKVWGVVLAQLVPKQPYRAVGGLHLRAGCERVRVLDNQIVGGAGHGVTLGGDLDPLGAPPPSAVTTGVPPSISATTGVRPTTATAGAATLSAALTGRASVAARALSAPPRVNVTTSGQFLAAVVDGEGRPLADVDIYLEADTVATDRSDVQGLASIKTAPGAYALSVAPAYRVVSVTEARDQGVLVNAVTLAPRTEALSRPGFLHEITLQANDISMMGLSGVGFALRLGAQLKGSGVTQPGNTAKTTLLAQTDALVLNLALTPLLLITDPVRDLVIRENRLHHNLRNPFNDLLRAASQVVGFGGITLPIVESVVINGNHIYENGPRAIDPVCGIFIGYGNDLDITGNVLADNGAITADYEQNRQAGIRGGIYVRFAGAVTAKYSSSTGRKPALRVHDNRVDQTAGRALTAFAFGPVSIANNHFNSEFTGRFGFIDALVGAVLVFNLGGIHRLVGRSLDANTNLGKVELSLPGGETQFADNYIRLGTLNRSLISHALLTFDDLGYSANTSSVYRGDFFFANGLLLADTVRATSSRLREDATRELTLSLLSNGRRANMTLLNQADHCILAGPLPPHIPPTIAFPNHILDSSKCSNADGVAKGAAAFLLPALATYAADLGGVLSENDYTTAEVSSLSQRYTSKSLATLNATQTATYRSSQYEAARLAAKHGSGDPRAVTLGAQADSGLLNLRVAAASAEVVGIETPTAPDSGSALSGRLANTRGQGQEGYTITLIRANGGAVETVGRTASSGAFAATYDARQTAVLVKEGDLFLRVTDLSDKEVLRDAQALRFSAGASVQRTLVVPVRVVPRSVVLGGTVIFGTGEEPPPPPPPVPPPTVRTPLDKLEIDDATRKRLEKGGIVDVEGVLETDSAKLATIVGDQALAARLQEAAKRVLAGTAPASRTPLSALDLDAATRKKLDAGGITDVEAITEATAARLTQVMGDRTSAAALRERAKTLLENPSRRATPPASPKKRKR